MEIYTEKDIANNFFLCLMFLYHIFFYSSQSKLLGRLYNLLEVGYNFLQFIYSIVISVFDPSF